MVEEGMVVETEGHRIWQLVSGDRNRSPGTFAKLEEQALVENCRIARG